MKESAAMGRAVGAMRTGGGVCVGRISQARNEMSWQNQRDALSQRNRKKSNAKQLLCIFLGALSFDISWLAFEARAAIFIWKKKIVEFYLIE